PGGAVTRDAAVDRVRARLEVDLAGLRALRDGKLEPAQLRVGEQERVRAAQVVVVDLGDPGRGDAELRGLEAQRWQGVDLQGGDRRPGRLLEPARRLTLLFAGPERDERGRHAEDHDTR